MPEPLLKEIVKIRANRLRAVRLEDDLSNSHLLSGYTLTAQALSVLGRVVDGLTNHTRAWTLTGPYGSGKSFFGLFLAHLLDVRQEGHAAAQAMVKNADPTLLERLQETFGQQGGLWTVAVTGSRASLQECLARGLTLALETENFPSAMLAELERVRRADSRLFLDWVKSFVQSLSQHRPATTGVLILFDELGKALEYAAAHPQESDVYLLQELAEFAAHSNDHPFVFVGILHQAFEGYATFLDRITQREWAKVQGRFEDIPFTEPPVQQMRLLAQAFEGTAAPPAVSNVTLADWRPVLMEAEEFEALSRRVYPLHPSVFTTLPYVFRRLAQNERSVFAYLSLQEPFGFQEFLANHQQGEYLYLTNIFDYLLANYQGRIYSSGRARPLTETIERLESAVGLGQIEQDLLKTIGMLTWLGEISNLQATESLVISALTPLYEEEILRAGLASLQRRSLIVYRRFNNTYAIWQGSDVDIEERLQAAREELETSLSVAEILQNYLPPKPLLARRHSYQKGVTRFFNICYVDIHNQANISLQPSSAASGLVLLCLPGNLGEINHFVHWAINEPLAECPNVIIGVTGRAIRLRELALELRGLHWVRENTPALRDDPVARREWRTRLSNIEHTIRAELEEAFNLHQITGLEGCQWYYAGEEVTEHVRRGLSGLLSEICDQLYPNSPSVWNELLNRRELTSQGAAARRTLIEGILTRADQPLLGIQKFPPERSMYEALLYRGGLHCYDGVQWYLAPPSGEDTLNLQPAWKAMEDFVFGVLPEPRPLQDLFDLLAAPPYGLTNGLMPVLLAVFYKVHEREMTLYREGTLLIEPSIADWEVLLRRPELFSLAGCRVRGMRQAVLERMARGLKAEPHVMPVVRALIGRLKALPEHAWRTQKLPAIALNLRRVVDSARSPESFLFVELPQALDVAPFEEDNASEEQFSLFFERLNQALEALANATPHLLAWARDIWLQACGLPAGEQGWEEFQREAQEMVLRVTQPQLVPLLKRAAESQDQRTAVESVLAFIANRPLRTWTDMDAERFAAQAAHLGNLWRKEKGEDQADLELNAEAEGRVNALADRLEEVLRHSAEPPELLQAAVRVLLRRLRQST